MATTLSSDPNYLAYGTAIGFIVKALGAFQKQDGDYLNPTEDILLALGGILLAYGTGAGMPALVSIGSLISLVGKTIPSLGGPQTIKSRTHGLAPAS